MVRVQWSAAEADPEVAAAGALVHEATGPSVAGVALELANVLVSALEVAGEGVDRMEGMANLHWPRVEARLVEKEVALVTACVDGPRYRLVAGEAERD